MRSELLAIDCIQHRLTIGVRNPGRRPIVWWGRIGRAYGGPRWFCPVVHSQAASDDAQGCSERRAVDRIDACKKILDVLVVTDGIGELDLMQKVDEACGFLDGFGKRGHRTFPNSSTVTNHSFCPVKSDTQIHTGIHKPSVMTDRIRCKT